MTMPPSISQRLARALTVWTLALGLAVGASIWVSASQEVDELLDEALQSTGLLMAGLVGSVPAGSTARAGTDAHFAWQWVDADGTVRAHSPLAPATAWHLRAMPGFSDAGGFRIFGLWAGADGAMLYVAQTRRERREAQVEVWLSAMLATLALGLLGHVWLRARVRSELAPLQRLSRRLQALPADDAPTGASRLGAAERQELQPVHDAVDALADRLALRLSHERAFAAQAAHALRTPLAGIDAQLAVALREAPAGLRERLSRVRDGAGRLQTVVDALLGLFRSGGPLRRAPVALADAIGRLPAPGLVVAVDPDAQVQADADLLAAALINLVDNARRHGAAHVRVDCPRPQCVRVADDGPGLADAQRLALQAALDDERYGDGLGLGLTLADRVARAHGGRLRLQPSDVGLVVLLDVGAAALPSTSDAG